VHEFVHATLGAAFFLTGRLERIEFALLRWGEVQLGVDVGTFHFALGAGATSFSTGKDRSCGKGRGSNDR
jgi:hypothetical protein